jgi:transposase-like protein
MYFCVSDRVPIINIRAKSARRSGLWIALREVYGATKEQRCWFHKTGNVLNAMPKSV